MIPKSKRVDREDSPTISNSCADTTWRRDEASSSSSQIRVQLV